MVDAISGLVDGGIAAYDTETDLELLRGALPAHIKMAEVLQRNDPRHAGANLLLARLYGAYALAVLEPGLAGLGSDPSAEPGNRGQAAVLRTRTDGCHRRGVQHALAALEERHPGLGQRLSQVSTRDAALAAMAPRDAPALFWYAYHLGSRVNLNRSNLRLLAQGHVAEAAMHRVISLAPDLEHGAAHLFLMVFLARQPTAMGRPDPRVEVHYRAVHALADGARLAADVLYAREVLARSGNRAAFLDLLDRVIDQGGAAARCLLDRLAIEQALHLRADPGLS